MKKLFTTLFLFLLAVCTWAQSIWNNPINGSNPSTNNPFTAGQVVNANITVSGIGRGPGIGANAGANRYNANNWAGSFDANDYFTWTLTPNAGFEIDFISLVFRSQSSGTGPNTYSLRSSLDNYASAIATFTIPTSGNESGPFTANLSAATFQNITSPITFRMYAWGGNNTAGTNSINEFTFNGTVNLAVANSITTTGTYGSFCNGVANAVNVTYSATGTFTGTFTAQLSDATGSFANPTVIGSGTSSPIAANIPAGIAAGTGYRIRVINNTPNTIGTDNGSNITIHASPVVNLGNDTAFCTGTNLNLTLNAGNPGAGYAWSNFSTSQTLNVSTAGTFSVTVTAPNNCVGSDQITVTELSLPTVDLGGDLAYCAGSAFAATLDAGNAGATYDWNNGAAATQTLDVTQAGTYSVVVTDANGCENADTVTVTETPLPVVDLGNDLSYCFGDNFSATLDAGNAGATFDWNNGTANTQTFDITTAGMYSVQVTDVNGCQQSDTVVVTENPLPVVDLGNNFVSYCAGTNFSLVLDAGNPGASYNWNNGAANTQTFTVTGPGLYGVLVTDVHGCQNADGVAVTENSLPTVNLGNDLSYCTGSAFSQVLDAGNAGASYDWNNGLANTQTLTVTTAGTYKVTVTNGNGCENTDSVVVVENPLPVVNLGNDMAYCAGVAFSQTLDAGNTGASYDWNNGSAATQTFTVTGAGAYFVQVTDVNGCQQSDTLVVVEHALPTVDLGSDLAYCVGDNFSQNLDAGNPGATYDWNGGLANTQTYTVTTAGTYTVVVTDANGCQNTDDVVVTEHALPVVDLGGDLSYCAGSNFSQTLDAGNAGAAYNWNNGLATTQTLHITTQGLYSVIVTDANGCQNMDMVVVTENALPVVALGNDTAYCAGTTFSMLLDAQNVGSTYSWNGGVLSSQIFAVSQAGTYSVLVTDANGCQNTDEVVVTEYALPVINLGNDTSYCEGSALSLVLDAQNPGSTYLWGNGSITQTVTATQAGTYTVTVTDANGCVNTDQLVVTENPLPTIDLGNDVSTPNTFHILNAGLGFSGYLWNPGGQTTPQITVTQSGTYTVTVTNADGCSASDAINVTLGTASVSEEMLNDMHISIYPNPATEMLKIDMDYQGNLKVNIVSVNGQRLWSKEVSNYEAGQVLEIDLTTWNAGVYIIRMAGPGFETSRTFIVNK